MLFGKWSGNEVKLDGEELLIMKESDIMGVLTDRSRRQEEGRVSASQFSLSWAAGAAGVSKDEARKFKSHSSSHKNSPSRAVFGI